MCVFLVSLVCVCKQCFAGCHVCIENVWILLIESNVRLIRYPYGHEELAVCDDFDQVNLPAGIFYLHVPL